jgi:hypothetical protein
MLTSSIVFAALLSGTPMYKCIDPKTQRVSYSQRPCEGTIQSKVITAPNEVLKPATELPPNIPGKHGNVSPAVTTLSAPKRPAVPDVPDTCRAEAVGIRRDIDQRVGAADSDMKRAREGIDRNQALYEQAYQSKVAGEWIAKLQEERRDLENLYSAAQVGRKQALDEEPGRFAALVQRCGLKKR